MKLPKDELIISYTITEERVWRGMANDLPDELIKLIKDHAATPDNVEANIHDAINGAEWRLDSTSQIDSQSHELTEVTL